MDIRKYSKIFEEFSRKKKLNLEETYGKCVDLLVGVENYAHVRK